MVYVTKLMINDIRNIARDRLLLYAAVAMPVVVILLCRTLLPWISENVYDLSGMYPLLFLMMLIMVPMMFGFIITFLIMDERDENLLIVLRVMPISRNGYLFYRMILMIVFAFIYIAMFPTLTGLVDVPFLHYLPIALLFALFTPLIGLAINNLANNKIQAFAVFKTFGGVFFLPLFAFFIQGDLKYAFGVIPNFWTFMAFDTLVKTGGNDYVFLGIGLAYHLGVLALLFYLFNKKF